MTAALIDRLLCSRCGRSLAAKLCTCRPEQPATLAAQVRRRHDEAVRRAQYGSCEAPLPDAPERTRWVIDRWDCAHLVGCDGASLCGKVAAGLGSRPAQAGARWCRTCGKHAGVEA